MNIRQLLPCWGVAVTLLQPMQVAGYGNYCVEFHHPVDRPSVFCSGVIMPASQTRNFKYEQLLCTSGSDSRTRTPVAFDEESWRDKLNTDRQEAYDMLRQLPDPQWQGVIHYQSYLHWSWEECELVTSATHCGTKRVCETVTRPDGKKEERCENQPETCYADIEKSKSVLCSHEQMQYDIRYLKKDVSEWNPGQAEFIDRLANGYDLLPGEQETVITSNGVGLLNSAWLHPDVYFKNRRNDYKITGMTEAGFVSGALKCQQNSDYHVGFMLLARARIRSRSGNAFSLPISHDGEPLEALIWQSALDYDRKRQEQGYPVILRVQDYSATALQEFALDTGDIFKHIVIRIQLYEQTILGILPWALSTIYIHEGKGIIQNLNALSEEQSVRRSSLWEITLATSSIDPNRNLYRVFIPWFVYYPGRLFLPAEELSYESQLRPGGQYQLSLTVYQKGLSIYYQSCEDEPDAWDCRFYAGWGWLSPNRYERNFYSEGSMDVAFTSPDNINLRTWWPMIWASISLLDDAALAAGLWVVITRINRTAKN